MNIPAKFKYGKTVTYYTIIDFIEHKGEIQAIVITENRKISTINIKSLEIDDIDLIPKTWQWEP